MAYSKQTWDTTSYVTPTRMNHIEDGIEGVDLKTASDIEFSSGVSIADKVNSVEVKSYSFNGTTTASGALVLPTDLLNKKVLNVIYDPTQSQRGLVFVRGDGYCTCFDNSLQPITNTSVYVIAYYTN